MICNKYKCIYNFYVGEFYRVEKFNSYDVFIKIFKIFFCVLYYNLCKIIERNCLDILIIV